MEPIPFATPGKARPLALLGGLLVIAATTYALLVGCGGKSQESNTSSNTESSATPTATSAAPTPNTTVGDTTGEAAMDPLVLGNKIYQERCALCHGPEGKGDGPAAAGLNPKPRNHTDGAYMKTRTDAQLLEVIHHGKGGMPAWGGILNETEINAVLKHVRTLAK
jgi:mono/diheme cytochrome c family protein